MLTVKYSEDDVEKINEWVDKALDQGWAIVTHTKKMGKTLFVSQIVKSYRLAD